LFVRCGEIVTAPLMIAIISLSQCSKDAVSQLNRASVTLLIVRGFPEKFLPVAHLRLHVADTVEQGRKVGNKFCKIKGKRNMIDGIERREFLTGSALLAGAATAGVFTYVERSLAAPIGTPVPYQVNGRPFEGMIVYDDSVKTKRPVIFMQPDWNGVDADNIAQARVVAGKNYVVLVADMFGQGYANKTKTRPDLFAAVGALHGDLPFTLACGGAAYEALLAEANKLGLIETGKTVAIGYCAGAGFMLEQARAGADFKAVVAFHVTNPNPSVAGTPCNIKGRVLAVHGSADTVTPKPKIDALAEELTQAKVDWQVMMIGGMAHGLDDKLRRKAYMLMNDFFTETL
jgi:dienelactone hydrolase